MRLKQYEEVFKKHLGVKRDFKATLTVNENTYAVFRKARSILFTIKDTIGNELDQLEPEGILKKVNHNECATPVVLI